MNTQNQNRLSAEKAATLDILRSVGHQQEFKARQTIFARGDLGDTLAIIDSGAVRISVFSSDGRELALALLGAGEVIGEVSAIDGGERTADVIAVGRVKATVIHGAELKKLLKSDEKVLDMFLRLMCERIRSANAHAESHALNSLAGRLSLFFINNGHELEDGSLALQDLPSQSELARLVGGARESVNRQFRSWRDAGLLETDGDGYKVPDPVRLQEDALNV